MEKDEVLRVIEEAARKKQTELDLSKNQLTSLPAEIGQLTNLTRLDLSVNQLTSLPAKIGQLKNLTELYLSGNQLTILPPEIVQLTSLTTLGLSGNQLTTLPPEIVQLKNLTRLDLSVNQLTSLPAKIGQLKNLTELYLSGNQLTSLPAKIGQLTNLTTLYLSGNQLTSLPAKIGQLTNLTALYLSKNELKRLPAGIGLFKNLTRLDLSGNQLTALPPESVQLTNLTTLDLSGNELKRLPAEIGQLTNLTRLDLYVNQLTFLPAKIGQLTNLTVLDLSKNELKRLPAEIGLLKDLTRLDLSGNQLTSLPAKIGQLTNLFWLDLSANPLKLPPPEIVGKGIEGIRSYLKGLEADKQALNEVKVLLVGDGGAGKTSLVKQLLGEEYDKHELQTHGINLRDWKSGDILVHLWDFGGQEIMHATHQFFLSKRSLYILVLDGRRDEKTEYWLKHIESFGGDSPILVVLNKIDENPSFEVNRKFLQDKYKGIQRFYRVSCAKGKGIKDFTKALSKAVANVELIETMWPKTWFNVKAQLEDMADNFITIDEYKEMCTKETITEKTDQDTLVDFLNDLGVMLHFKDFELLDTHVLEPKWVTSAVYRIINSDKLAECNGVLKLDLLDEILKKGAEDDYYYPAGKYRYIIDLMKKFELCYEIDNETVLLPDLLEVQEPEFNFDPDAALKFVIDYDFLPRSVLPRFIVKMHKDIKNKLQWKTGVVLEDKAIHSTAVIKADERDERIYIYVAGEQKRDYFSTIRKTFRDINDSFKKLEAKELVPLPDNDEITIEYEELIGYLQMRKDEYIVGKLRKTYSVKELLNGVVSEEEREEEPMKIHKSGGNVYVSVKQKQENVQKQDVKQEVKQEVKINLKIYLPAIQSEFREFKREVTNLDEELDEELEDLEDDLLEITPTSEEGKVNKAINKLSLFMEKLKDKNSKFSTIVKGTKKGIELAQKLAVTYNKFAQALGLDLI